ncbi:Peptidase S24-like protein [compost metagenome]
MKDAPVANNDAKTTSEDVAVNGTVTATDVDGDTLTFTKGSNPTNGTVTVNADGTYTYTPNANFNGTDSFTVKASDGKGGESTATVTITVTPVNDAPIVTTNPVTTEENKPVSGKVTSTDVDGDTLIAEKGTDPTNGTVVVNPDGTYTYTPKPGFNGKDSFEIVVKDGKGGETKVVVDVTVTPVNDAPVASNDSKTTNEDTPVNGKVAATDPDGDTLIFTKGNNPSNGTVVVNPDGTYTYTPNTDFNGKDSFEIVIKDGKGGETTVVIEVTVNPVNDAPVASNDSKTTNEDTPVNGKVTATDAEGDALTFTKGSNPTNGSVVVNIDGTYTYTPNADFNGKDSFDFIIKDGKGGETKVVIDVTVTPVNDAPIVTVDPVSTDENKPVTGKVTAKDADGDAPTAEKGTDPTNGTVVVNPDGTYTYTPKPGFNGKDSFEIVVKDGKGGETKVIVDVTVSPVNDAPVASNDNKTTNEDTPVSGKITATDADGDAMTFIKGSNPSNGTVVVNADGTYTYTPNADFNGTDSFTVKVSDGKGGETTATITITVKAVNDAPVVTAGPVTTTENTPVSGKVTSTDADGDPLTAEKGTDPANGTVVVNPDGTYTYTPKPGFNGKDSFEIVVKDGKGGETKVVVDVTVDPANNTADLMIEKRIVKSTSDLKVGDWVQYEIVVTSKGPAKATNVKVADKLMTLLGKPEDVKSDIGNVTYSDAAHGIDWVIGIMDANTKATLTFKSQIVKAGKLTNSATVSSDVKDDNTVNNTGTTPVDVVDNKPVFVPNAFTPNGDGKNERFTIPGIEQYPGSTLHIFNRWGNEVFYSGSYDNEWVGQGLSEGTYFYILTINKLEGKTIQKGWVLLKR